MYIHSKLQTQKVCVVDQSNTSNGHFAVDREIEYMELVSRRVLGELFGPPGELLGPPQGALWALGGRANISSTFVKMSVSTST